MSTTPENVISSIIFSNFYLVHNLPIYQILLKSSSKFFLTRQANCSQNRTHQEWIFFPICHHLLSLLLKKLTDSKVQVALGHFSRSQWGPWCHTSVASKLVTTDWLLMCYWTPSCAHVCSASWMLLWCHDYSLKVPAQMYSNRLIEWLTE